jgi:hypothetical protein
MWHNEHRFHRLRELPINQRVRGEPPAPSAPAPIVWGGSLGRLRERAGELNESRTPAVVSNQRKRADQLDRRGLGERRTKKSIRRPIRHRGCRRSDPEGVGDPLEARASDPVGAPFIFLHLLECHADASSKLDLRYAELHSARPHPLPDLDVAAAGLRPCVLLIDSLSRRPNGSTIASSRAASQYEAASTRQKPQRPGCRTGTDRRRGSLLGGEENGAAADRSRLTAGRGAQMGAAYAIGCAIRRRRAPGDALRSRRGWGDRSYALRFLDTTAQRERNPWREYIRIGRCVVGAQTCGNFSEKARSANWGGPHS